MRDLSGLQHRYFFKSLNLTEPEAAHVQLNHCRGSPTWQSPGPNSCNFKVSLRELRTLAVANSPTLGRRGRPVIRLAV